MALPVRVEVPDTVKAPLKFPVFALRTQRCVVVPNAVPTVLDSGLTPVPPDDVIPLGAMSTLTEVLPRDIVVELANKPFEVALMVPDPNPVLAFT